MLHVLVRSLVSIGAMALALASTDLFAAAPRSAGTSRVSAAAEGPRAMRTPRAVLAEIESLDRAAAKAQQRAAAASGKAAQRTTRAAWMSAEVRLDRAVGQALARMPAGGRREVVIDEPLAIAMLDLGIGVRRRLGPSFATEVAGLTTDPGCSGDLVAQRLVAGYGQAASVRLLVTSGVAGDRSRLHAFAVQVACLSERQLGLLDEALAESFDRSTERLSLYELRPLVPAFARLAAPLELLVLDARKHRGQWARAWQWFSAYGPTIEADVARAGWPSGLVYLWDRRRAKLLGFASCAAGSVQPNCVDLQVLLRSLRDPRALGLGGCALAAMVSQPSQLIGGDPRYVCAASLCDASHRAGMSSTTSAGGRRVHGRRDGEDGAVGIDADRARVALAQARDERSRDDGQPVPARRRCGANHGLGARAVRHRRAEQSL